jgi:hypothetical protein
MLLYLAEAFLCTMNTPTETRTYVGKAGTSAYDGFMGLRIGERYSGVTHKKGRVLVSLVGSRPGSGVLLRAEDWGKWFVK